MRVQVQSAPAASTSATLSQLVYAASARVSKSLHAGQKELALRYNGYRAFAEVVGADVPGGWDRADLLTFIPE